MLYQTALSCRLMLPWTWETIPPSAHLPDVRILQQPPDFGTELQPPAVTAAQEQSQVQRAKEDYLSAFDAVQNSRLAPIPEPRVPVKRFAGGRRAVCSLPPKKPSEGRESCIFLLLLVPLE